MSYAKGRRLEYRTIRYLEAQGYRCIRSAGSHGAVDVVAVNGTGGLFVQVKANRLPSLDERETFAAYPCPPGFKRIIHRWRDYGKEPEAVDVGESAPNTER
ncbi:MAG: hypothetical protein HYY13_04120 [Nitrospirae bacterium]|nr:hypothetical protein [Nitrospirota bacterium]